MEPSSGQQRLLFVVVVLVLAGLGVYLISTRTHHRAAATPPASVSATSLAPQAPQVPVTSPAPQAPQASATSPASVPASVPTGSGGIASIRSFGPGSITFVVNIAQRLATTQGTSTKTTQYAVTVVSAAGGWQVNDIELAGAGNQ